MKFLEPQSITLYPGQIGSTSTPEYWFVYETGYRWTLFSEKYLVGCEPVVPVL